MILNSKRKIIFLHKKNTIFMFCVSLMRIHNYDFYKTQNKKKKKEWSEKKKTHEMGGKSCMIRWMEVSKKNEVKISSDRTKKRQKNCFHWQKLALVKEMASIQCYLLSNSFSFTLLICNERIGVCISSTNYLLECNWIYLFESCRFLFIFFCHNRWRGQCACKLHIRKLHKISFDWWQPKKNSRHFSVVVIFLLFWFHFHWNPV